MAGAAATQGTAPTTGIFRVHGLLLCLMMLVFGAGALGLVNPNVVQASAVACALVAAYTLVGWRLYIATGGGAWIINALLYLDAVVGVSLFFFTGEFETPNLALVCLVVFMTPLFTSKKHAWGVATTEFVTYLVLMALRHSGSLPYAPLATPENAADWNAALTNEAYLGDHALGFLLLVYGAAFVAGEASLGLLTSQQALETEVDKATAELARQRDQLEAANKELAAVERIRSNFFSNISHEFRTPLTLILGPLEGHLADPTVPPRLRESLDLMLRNARRLLRLINQLLALSRVDASKLALHPVRDDLVRFVRQRAASFHSAAERKGIDFEFASNVDSSEAVFDAAKLEDILYNLLSNALKFTSAGGRIRVRLDVGDEVLLEVRDTGAGIPAEQVDRIFDRFHQVDAGSSRAHEGSGIGLALVHELVEFLGGRIDVQSEVGFGTTFTVVLPPLAADPDVTEPAPAPSPELALASVAPAASAHETTPGADGPHLLLIDDNPDIRSYLRSSLKGFRFTEAGDGEQGLVALREDPPDLVICDVMMPRLDGYGFVREVRRDEALAAIPIILLTAKADPTMRVEGLDAGADDYLSKPFNAAELEARVRNLLLLRSYAQQLQALNANLEARVASQVSQLVRGQRLGRFLPQDVVDQVLGADEEVHLRSERRLVTPMFTDLSGFTALSDRTAPERVTAVLNEYLGAMISIVEEHHGLVDKVMGDGLLILWGATGDSTAAEQARNAVAAGVAMQRRFVDLCESWRQSGLDHEMGLRIGVHQDYVTVGTFGSEYLLSFTAIGTGVNTAARLEKACPEGCVQASFAVHAQVAGDYAWGELKELRLKGLQPLRAAARDPSAAETTPA